jgi:hypothetical protein
MTGIAASIASEIGADRLVTDEATLAAHRTDYLILAHLRRRQGRLASQCGGAATEPGRGGAVVSWRAPRHADRAVWRRVRRGWRATPDEALVIDLRRMVQLLEVSDESLTARAGGLSVANSALAERTRLRLRALPQSLARHRSAGWSPHARRTILDALQEHGGPCLSLEVVRRTADRAHPALSALGHRRCDLSSAARALGIITG